MQTENVVASNGMPCDFCSDNACSPSICKRRGNSNEGIRAVARIPDLTVNLMSVIGLLDR